MEEYIQFLRDSQELSNLSLAYSEFLSGKEHHQEPMRGGVFGLSHFISPRPAMDWIVSKKVSNITPFRKIPITYVASPYQITPEEVEKLNRTIAPISECQIAYNYLPDGRYRCFIKCEPNQSALIIAPAEHSVELTRVSKGMVNHIPRIFVLNNKCQQNGEDARATIRYYLENTPGCQVSLILGETAQLSLTAHRELIRLLYRDVPALASRVHLYTFNPKGVLIVYDQNHLCLASEAEIEAREKLYELGQLTTMSDDDIRAKIQCASLNTEPDARAFIEAARRVLNDRRSGEFYALIRPGSTLPLTKRDGTSITERDLQSLSQEEMVILNQMIQATTPSDKLNKMLIMIKQVKENRDRDYPGLDRLAVLTEGEVTRLIQSARRDLLTASPARAIEIRDFIKQAEDQIESRGWQQI